MPIGLKGNSDGSGAIQIGGSDAISISTGLNTTFAGTITATGTVAGTTGTLYPIVSGTAVSATGTAVDFTGIPSWAKRITVMFNGVSTNGTSNPQIQLGTGSTTFTTSGYQSQTSNFTSTGATNSSNATSGFVVGSGAATNTLTGQFVLVNVSANIWVGNGCLFLASTAYNMSVGGVTLGAALTGVRITTVNGTDTFDAGTINILFE